jgi:PPOX class probable F420-dependent enzyme
MPEPRPQPPLSVEIRALLADARRAVLTTIDARNGRPRSVPVCFVLVGDALYSPLDEKPKASTDPRDLRRVRNLTADARATILVDRWDEDWTRLAFAELACRGRLIGPDDPDHAAAVMALRAKYPQYATHRLEERPMIRFEVDAATAWTAAGGKAR